MFFILSKILHFFLSPFIWCLALGVIAILVKNKRIRKHLIIATFGILLLFSNTALYTLAVKSLQDSGSFKKDSTYNIGIVLGGMAAYNQETELPTFNQAGDRLLQTLQLYKSGVIKKILISGGSGNPFIKEEKEADIIKKYLLQLQVSEENIIIENNSRNTYENAKYSAEILRTTKTAPPYLLISSAIHLPRAKKCFAKQGIQTDSYPANFESGTAYKLSDFLKPNPKTLNDWEFLLHEIVGAWVYKAIGYL